MKDYLGNEIAPLTEAEKKKENHKFTRNVIIFFFVISLIFAGIRVNHRMELENAARNYELHKPIKLPPNPYLEAD